MKLTVQVMDAKKPLTDCIIAGVYCNNELTPQAQKLDQESNGFIKNLLQRIKFRAKPGEILPLFHLPNTPIAGLILVGCGKKEDMDAQRFHQIVRAACQALACHSQQSCASFLCELSPPGKTTAWKIRQIALILLTTFYRFDEYKTEKDPLCPLQHFLLMIQKEKDLKISEAALKEAQAISNGMAFAKDLGNTPSNICTPTYLATAAKNLSKKYSNIKATILDEKEMKKLGMEALLAVAKGSREPPKLICLQYQGTNKKQKPIALVGKGVTFDTGGNSLKQPDSMVGMKYDMCGAATVLGTIAACAQMKLAQNVVGIIAAVENMPGGNAYKPEDILVTMSGKTIEVISTDAEGRVILADALTYSEKFNPEAIIDIATLTGAVVIALGFHATGLLSNDQKLADALLKAGEEINDRAWQLPLWEEYKEQLKSPFADMANVGGRPAGAITAGIFLSEFAKNYPWAHLDVAGTAAMMFGTDRYATGRPIPLLIQYLKNRSLQ